MTINTLRPIPDPNESGRSTPATERKTPLSQDGDSFGGTVLNHSGTSDITTVRSPGGDSLSSTSLDSSRMQTKEGKPGPLDKETAPPPAKPLKKTRPPKAKPATVEPTNPSERRENPILALGSRLRLREEGKAKAPASSQPTPPPRKEVRKNPLTPLEFQKPKNQKPKNPLEPM